MQHRVERQRLGDVLAHRLGQDVRQLAVDFRKPSLAGMCFTGGGGGVAFFAGGGLGRADLFGDEPPAARLELLHVHHFGRFRVRNVDFGDLDKKASLKFDKTSHFV